MKLNISKKIIDIVFFVVFVYDVLLLVANEDAIFESSIKTIIFGVKYIIIYIFLIYIVLKFLSYIKFLKFRVKDIKLVYGAFYIFLTFLIILDVIVTLLFKFIDLNRF